MRIKHGGQMPTPTNPKHDASSFFAANAKRIAACHCGGNVSPVLVDAVPVPVTVRKRRHVQANVNP